MQPLIVPKVESDRLAVVDTLRRHLSHDPAAPDWADRDRSCSDDQLTRFAALRTVLARVRDHLQRDR